FRFQPGWPHFACAAVFPNRRISVPPRMQSAAIPAEIEKRTHYAWGLETSGALTCWGAFGARGAGVKVGVLDTGVEARHPDLVGKVVAFAEFGPNNAMLKAGVTHAYDDDGHGTHVCGTIAGGNASGRWIGMAPEAQLIAAKVLKNGVGSDAQILAGMAWAIQQGAHVLNLSLGGWSAGIDVIDTYTNSILQANGVGVPVVTAIGNEGSGTSGSPGTDYFSIGVGATDILDRAAGFSGGRTHVIHASPAFKQKDLPIIFIKPDLSAPGVDVYSCKRGGRWGYESGTSMAAPHVSGAFALLLSGIGANRLPPHDLRRLSNWDRVDVLQSLLLGSALELGEKGKNARFGHGRLDIAAAYSNALNLKYLS
ncbi:MAG TPA: S8 family serine peptidase, partial [Noviherbaspirillum sp.]|nr:S8 family serine peptidase [Noviherbaspirillum sp.]